MRAIEDSARQAGREPEQVTAMDRAYGAVATSAGDTQAASYFAEDRGPRPEWEAAATTAAEAVAACVVADLIPDEMLSFILEPWAELLDENEA
jgi:hypothetical protein